MAFTPLCSMRGSARVNTVDALLFFFLDFLPARKKTAHGIRRTYVKETITHLERGARKGSEKRSSTSSSDSIESSAIARIHIHKYVLCPKVPSSKSRWHFVEQTTAPRSLTLCWQFASFWELICGGVSLQQEVLRVGVFVTAVHHADTRDGISPETTRVHPVRVFPCTLPF